MTLYEVKDGKIVDMSGREMVRTYASGGTGPLPKPQAIMPSFEEFVDWWDETTSNFQKPLEYKMIYDFFASRIKPIEFPSDEEINREAGRRFHRDPEGENGFNAGVEWLRERLK